MMKRIVAYGFLFCAVALPVLAQTGPAGEALPRAEELLHRPYVQYKLPGEAEVLWQTRVPGATVLSWGKIGADKATETEPTPKSQHRVTLKNLEPKTIYTYTITTAKDSLETTSPEYIFDTTFNYAPTPITKDNAPDSITPEMQQRSSQLIEQSAKTQGYALLLGCGHGDLAFALAQSSKLTVIGLDTDNARIQEGRQQLYKTGSYGTRIQLRQVDDYADLPFTSHYANLIIAHDLTDQLVLDELLRVLHPRGSLLLENPGTALIIDHAPVIPSAGSTWFHYKAPGLPGVGQWSHQYGDAANTANSGDTLMGAVSTDDMMVQWVGRPGADFGIDRNPRMPAPLSANGRLFHQGLNRMCGLDAYNGAMYWMLEIPGLRRVNMPRDTSNWCVDDKVLYTAVEDLLWRVDAEYGTVLDMLPLPDTAQRDTHDWGYVAQNETHLYGSSVKRGSSYTDFWGGPAWYDGTEGPGTWKVCSDSLFALNKADNTTAWQYTHGRIINTTIAMAGNSIVFVECRHPKVLEAPTGRIELEELWLDQYLVALDASTGEKRWEKPIDLPDGIVVYFLVVDSGAILVTSSENNNYHIHAFDLGDGSDKWNATHAWPSDNHGGHMQHPAIANGVIFLEPMGYRVANGEVVTDKMGAREGCATVAATKNALIYRGQSRRVAMWDIEEQRVSSWLNLRPSCWLSVVPSGGMILAPEGGGGCSCGGWIETSLGFIPASLNKPL